MIQIRLWAHKIEPIIEKVENKHFNAIAICENTAQLIAKMFNGKCDCSSCGCVQYSDTVNFNTLSEDDEKFILSAYPFTTVRKPTNYILNN